MTAPAQGEGYAEIPGARLRYKLSGAPGDLPLLVFENGWGASWECWAWLEPQLAPHARLLFYNRAGIGGSTCHGPQTAAALSEQLAGLLTALQIRQPVVLVGHSYGGLMCGVHAAQKPQLPRAMVELDPSPDSAEPLLDRQLKLVFPLGRLALLCARLGMPPPLFSSAGKRLPAPHGEQMMKRSFGSAASLRAALEELKLLHQLRAAIAAGVIHCPQLVLSAGRASQVEGWLGRLLARSASEQTNAVLRSMQAQHQRRAARNPNARWEALPYDHGGLVFSSEGAQASATRILQFLHQHCR